MGSNESLDVSIAGTHCAGLLEGITQSDEHRRTIFAEADIDPADDVGADQCAEADPGVELKAVRC